LPKFQPRVAVCEMSSLLTLDQWKDRVDALADLGFQCITISGENPFAWPHWREVANYIRERDRGLSMISNACRISDYDATYLSEIGTCTISLIIEGLKHGLFDSTLSSIVSLKRSSIRVCVITPVNKINFEELPLMKTLLTGSGVDLWQLEVKNHSITPDQYLRFMEFVGRSQNEYENERQMMKVQMTFEASHCMCNECGCVIRVKEDGDFERCS